MYKPLIPKAANVSLFLIAVTVVLNIGKTTALTVVGLFMLVTYIGTLLLWYLKVGKGRYLTELKGRAHNVTFMWQIKVLRVIVLIAIVFICQVPSGYERYRDYSATECAFGDNEISEFFRAINPVLPSPILLLVNSLDDALALTFSIEDTVSSLDYQNIQDIESVFNREELEREVDNLMNIAEMGKSRVVFLFILFTVDIAICGAIERRGKHIENGRSTI